VTTSLARLTEPKLRALIRARVRGEDADPPVDVSRWESPEDHLLLAHRETSDPKFRARLENAARGALDEAALGDLTGGPDAQAVRHLAALADGLGLEAAAPRLLAIAERGALGGHEGELDPEAEAMVLFALADLQPPKTLFPRWLALWEREIPRLWPVVSAGLRLSDPERALAILPEAVERAGRRGDFPLGDVLWAFATYEGYEAEDIAGALGRLSTADQIRCHEALTEVGSEEAEIAAWLPPQPARAPAWAAWKRPGPEPTRPPRLLEGASACG
jgi:hypothetical protein